MSKELNILVDTVKRLAKKAYEYCHIARTIRNRVDLNFNINVVIE